MARATWQIQTEGRSHTIELEHGYWSGSRSITVDGSVVYRGRKFFDTGGQYPFDVDGHRCVVTIKATSNPVRYSLSVDGELVEEPEERKLNRTLQNVLLGLAALALAALGFWLVIYAPAPIPQASDLRPISGRVADVQVAKGKYSDSLSLILAGSSVKLKYSDTDAYFQWVSRSIKKGDSVTVWVLGSEYDRGGTLGLWQIQKGNQGVSLRYQVELRGITNRMAQLAGMVSLAGALWLLWLLLRRMSQPALAADVEVAAQEMEEIPGVTSRRESVVPVAALWLPGIAAGLVALWWLYSQIYRVIELGADGVAALLCLMTGLVLGLPSVASLETLKETSRIERWPLRVAWVFYFAAALVVLSYVPMKDLAPLFGELAGIVGPSILGLASPAASLSLFAISLCLPGSASVKRTSIAAVLSGSLVSLLYLAVSKGFSEVEAGWLGGNALLVGWSAYAALRLVGRPRKRRSARSRVGKRTDSADLGTSLAQ